MEAVAFDHLLFDRNCRRDDRLAFRLRLGRRRICGLAIGLIQGEFNAYSFGPPCGHPAVALGFRFKVILSDEVQLLSGQPNKNNRVPQIIGDLLHALPLASLPRHRSLRPPGPRQE